jgi:transposase
MPKAFRPWDVDQSWLLPPSAHELVPPGHVAHFVRDTVREALDLSAILACYEEERGFPPYHPGMMVALLLYANCRGIYYSLRRIARGCEERVDFMAVTGLQRPDFRTIAAFRRRHLAALADLFGQVLRLCRAAGLVRLGHVAIDGSKLRANASRHKAMSYGRMKQAEAALAAEVSGWLERAGAMDAEDDARHGADRRGDGMPGWTADKARRLARIRAAKAALEAEATAPLLPPDDGSGPGPSSGMQRQGRPLRAEDGGPPDRAQRNFIDPDSRIQPTRDGFVQGYNAQAAVDAGSQVIVAQRLVAGPADYPGLVPLVDQVRDRLGRRPREVSADAGFCTEANHAAMQERRIAAYVPPGRARHGEASAAGRRALKARPLAIAVAAMLRRAGHRTRYPLRKQTAEPVFG